LVLRRSSSDFASGVIGFFPLYAFDRSLRMQRRYGNRRAGVQIIGANSE
jgi:hypothetical protein